MAHPLSRVTGQVKQRKLRKTKVSEDKCLRRIALKQRIEGLRVSGRDTRQIREELNLTPNSLWSLVHCDMPEKRHKWTTAEEARLLELSESTGKNWKLMTGALNREFASRLVWTQVKNKFYSHKKKLAELGFLDEGDKTREDTATSASHSQPEKESESSSSKDTLKVEANLLHGGASGVWPASTKGILVPGTPRILPTIRKVPSGDPLDLDALTGELYDNNFDIPTYSAASTPFEDEFSVSVYNTM